MKEIKLSSGHIAIVDDEDFERVNAIHWHAAKVRKHHVYGATNIKVDGGRRVLYLHRFILGITDRDIIVDHKNFDTLNNTRANLRTASSAENSRHRMGSRKGSQSGFRGVEVRKKKSGECTYYARLIVDKKKKTIGPFKTAEEAAREFDKAAKEYFGEFCGKLNYE